jgi:hypothetical protein
MEGEKRHTEKVMKLILFNRYKKTASPSLIRLTLELYKRITFLETILQVPKQKTDF